MNEVLDIKYKIDEENLTNNNEDKEIEVKASEPHLSALLGDFLADLDVSPSSKNIYRKNMQAFFRYLEEEGIRAPLRRDIIAYKDKLCEGHNPKTVNNHLCTIRQFFGWCSSYNIYPNIAGQIKSVRIDKTISVREALTSDQVRLILGNIDRGTPSGKQRYALVLLATTTGLRCQEISNINIEDYITEGNRKVLKIQGKGFRGKEQKITVGPMTDEAIRDALTARGHFNLSDPLFISMSNFGYGERITAQGIGKILKKILEENHFTGPGYTAHSFRHTAGMLGLAVSGNDVLAMRSFLRHRNVETTLGYIDHGSDKNEMITGSIEALLWEETMNE